MEGAGTQERSAVRCGGHEVVKTEVCGESAVKGKGQVVRPSCASLMETTNQTNGISSNGLDSKTSKIKQIVEDAISSDSKHAVMRILDQVNELSTAEKLLLYLKLPTGKCGNLDPLRQPLNPLGSRFEIHQTITWIRTHLEEDQDVSLPKQDVYDEYISYCNSNTMKPLSTADFGKVMKQVFPRVRPRRLGTRGNSRYCYSGMRKKMKLEAPLLPDIGEETKPGGSSCSEDEVFSAASCLIREWAEKLLGIRFENLQDLACHLVDNMCVDSRSVAAFTVLSGSKSAPNLCTGKAVGGQNKHRETQLQLQRKLQEREVIREQKRKLQEQAAAVSKGRGKRYKYSTNAPTQGEQANCDKKTPESTNAKMPIPRLANKPSNQLASVIVLPHLLQQKSPKKKYKPIQPKPEDAEEQEEELAQYFQEEQKLSQLRQLLERNIDIKQPPKPALQLSNGSQGSRRRVSFETSVMDSSPTTRRRIFSFTPISPGPHSPLGAQRTTSKPSSANASPFVSPRNTPVPRSRHNSGQSRVRHSVVRSNSVNSHYQLPRLHTFAVPTGPPPMMSFPQTDHNFLQAALLTPEQKPPDPLSQEVSRFFSDSEQNVASLPPQYRSQSVPLHQPLYNNLASVAPTPVPSEFTDFIPTGESADLLMNGDEGAELNSENLNRIFNLLDDVQEENKLSLTLDIDIAQRQPSRSYPNTPLPYTRDPVVSSFTASLPPDTSRSYPSTPLIEDNLFQQELARRNVSTLLDPTPFSELALDTLEALEGCDTLTQFVQEVSGPDHIAD